MIYFEQGRGPERVEPCRYDGSKLLLRGPRRDLDRRFIACLGGTETFGRFIGMPYPDLLEDRLGTTCVNFGWPNAGLDVFFNDRALIDCASRAELAVLQVSNAVNMSNMYYRVHHRRNDRLIAVTEALRALFPEVDFTRFSFTRHLLTYLRQQSPDRFAYVQKELSAVWVAGMVRLLSRIDTPVVLLWMSARSPDVHSGLPGLVSDPALVNRTMLDQVAPHAAGIVELCLTPKQCCWSEIGLSGEVPTKQQAEVTLGPAAHAAAADALAEALLPILDQKSKRPA